MVFTLGLIASAIVIIMAFTIKRNMIVKMSAIMGVVTTLQYLLLNEWGTAWLTFVGFLYAVGLMYEEKIPIMKGKSVAYLLLVIYSVGFFGINGFSFGWPLVAYAASLLGTFMLLLRNPLALKYAMFVNGGLWMIFQMVSGAHGQIPGEIVYLLGIGASIFYLKHSRKKGIPLNEVPEFSTLIRNRFVTAA